MRRWVMSAALAAVLWAGAGAAQQQPVWVQIEALPTLQQAEDRLRAYAAALPDVNGFDLGNGWYSVALGPYARDDAESVLRQYRAQGAIPSDSYIALPSAYERQVWPAGQQSAALVPPASAEPAPQEVEPLRQAEETRAEALRTERALGRAAHAELQTALQWSGHYSGAIDGLIGRGTRGAMERWQAANRYEPSGVLTTAQRAALFAQYNAVLDGMGLQTVQSAETGIEIALPLGVVAFDRLEPPFAHYAPTGDLAARVHLISQRGGRADLVGLFDVMQTLSVVPLDSTAEIRSGSFTLAGADDEIASHTQAELSGDTIKGFTLVWPAGDEARRMRVLQEMQASFRPIDGVLPATAGNAAQDIDLLSGLEIRRPARTRSGFYASADGIVVTTRDVAQDCTRLTLNDRYEAELLLEDAAHGLALLRSTEAIAPPRHASLRTTAPLLRSEVAVAGYSYGGRLGAPTLTYGRLADVKALDGAETRDRLELAALEGDAGGPVLDAAGQVFGMLLPREAGARQLPDGAAFSVDAAVIADLLAEAGIATPPAPAAAPDLHAEALGEMASEMVVLVSCWN
ncbi:serine protease [Poseidonocella sedimentorum]|uniref:Sporulation related domain-containing protein n=1 Tax=Poseidonocella sedimentorum TaxID=871652 RepID=A0A1I6DYZ5_9RHOB|nr:serine protease [Poseidonocella sedimentorum]SFR10551.1 Sporulation related domain-containing protein [Poseidonocella sedimentorum]